ncbi:MAG: hypothetical protein HQK55_12965, partial [Deltaproteobacteria bacterium]|nr:hypothetical protein [Deltaproteobacteria bacterium]
METKKIIVPRMFALLLLVMLTGCGKPDVALPDNPVERAAVQGLYSSYRESTMWEVRDPVVLRVQPMAPTKSFVQEHDPKELYCVCIKYEARYKVPWTTKDSSEWEKTVRNILVIKTRGDQFM